MRKVLKHAHFTMYESNVLYFMSYVWRPLGKRSALAVTPNAGAMLVPLGTPLHSQPLSLYIWSQLLVPNWFSCHGEVRSTMSRLDLLLCRYELLWQLSLVAETWLLLLLVFFSSMGKYSSEGINFHKDLSWGVAHLASILLNYILIEPRTLSALFLVVRFTSAETSWMFAQAIQLLH